MEYVISIHKCIRCGECCKNFPFVELSRAEVDAIARLTGLPVDAFTNSKDKAVEEYFLDFKPGGECLFLKEEGGHYSCGVYEARPAICKSFPSDVKQLAYCDLCRKKLG